MGFYDMTCSNDTYFYQACDKRINPNIKIFNNRTWCGGFQCQRGGKSEFLTLSWYKIFDMADTMCDGENDCLNTDLDESNHHCDNINNTCEDQGVCKGTYCSKTIDGSINSNHYICSNKICDGRYDCDDQEDEDNCSTRNETSFHANYLENREQIETSTEKGVDITCNEQNRISTNFSKRNYCRKKHCLNSNCRDKIEQRCKKAFSENKTCYLHKHFFCDETRDCDDGSDETTTICQAKTIKTCSLRVGNVTSRTIPVKWLKDGVEDCVDGSDENNLEKWKDSTCGQGNTLRVNPEMSKKGRNKTCENVYICQSGEPGFVELSELCDGIETCGNENNVCSASWVGNKVETKVPTFDGGLTKKLSFCQIGLHELRSQNNPCLTENFIFPDHEFYGVGTKTRLILPKHSKDCDYMYGEQYVYRSCTEKCTHSTCPLKTIPRYEVCPSQFPNRVGTLANNKYLAFFTVSNGDTYTNRYFVCEDKHKCLDYSQVCDLVKDCDDGSDEKYCTNHFKCNSSGFYIPKTSICDGVFDCGDYSDECNENCSKRILEGDSLKAFAWLIGVVSVLANVIVLVREMIGLKKSRNAVVLVNKSLIILISFGDFLTGCYLITISIYDSFIFQDSYCLKQTEWITSSECSIIGVFSTTGSQISLFSMTGLSIVRIYVIWTSKSRNSSGQVNLMSAIVVIALVLLVTVASVAIAVVPIVGRLEDFFVNGIKFSNKTKIFVGTPDKTGVLNILGAYHGRMTRKTIPSWERILEMVGEMFSHDFDYHDFANKSMAERVHFYGNDGVCLFKYFVIETDPQRMFVWSILAINLLCFTFICTSYLLIYFITSRSSSATGNQNESRRMNSMNRKIALIITTDFFCWIPFIVVCALHFFEVLDATPWYAVFSMVILPLNSVINPFLYDDYLIRGIRKRVRIVFSSLTNLSAFSFNRNSAQESAVQAGELAMRQMQQTG